MSTLNTIQTNGATEYTLDNIQTLLDQFTFLGTRLLVDATVTPSFFATTVAITVTTSSTSLLPTNASRKGFVVQATNPILVRLNGSVSPALYTYDLAKRATLEVENYCGTVTACTATGSTTVYVTEKF